VTVTQQVLATYPQDRGGMDRERLVARIDACPECAQACRDLIATLD
jgi:hypothetical protein